MPPSGHVSFTAVSAGSSRLKSSCAYVGIPGVLPDCGPYATFYWWTFPSDPPINNSVGIASRLGRGVGRACRVLACTAACVSPLAAPAQDIHGTLEQYFTGSTGAKGVVGDFRWASFSDQFSSKWGAVAGFVEEWGWQWADETYVSYDDRNLGLRLGR